MDGAQPEGEIKASVRDGGSIEEILILAADAGSGLVYFPFLRTSWRDDFIGVRKARTEGLVNFAHITPLLIKLKGEPIPDISGGFGWKGDSLRLVFPGHSQLRQIVAAKRWHDE